MQDSSHFKLLSNCSTRFFFPSQRWISPDKTDPTAYRSRCLSFASCPSRVQVAFGSAGGSAPSSCLPSPIRRLSCRWHPFFFGMSSRRLSSTDRCHGQESPYRNPASKPVLRTSTSRECFL